MKRVSNLSATSYNVYEICPMQWYYNYELLLLKKDSKALLIGSFFHELLECHYDSNKQLLEDSKKNYLTKLSEDDYNLALAMYDKYKENPLDGKIIEREYKFNLDIPGVNMPIKGKIDRIDDDKAVEYKTTSKDYKDEDVDTIQFTLYSYAVWKKTGKILPIYCYVMNKKKCKSKNYKPKIIKIQKTKEDFDIMESLLREFYKNITNENYYPKPGQHCFWCAWSKKNGDGTCEYSL